MACSATRIAIRRFIRPLYFVAHALLRAVSRLVSTLFCVVIVSRPGIETSLDAARTSACGTLRQGAGAHAMPGVEITRLIHAVRHLLSGAYFISIPMSVLRKQMVSPTAV